jgi:hypothetical protein
VTDVCERGKELIGTITGGELLDHVGDYQASLLRVELVYGLER